MQVVFTGRMSLLSPDQQTVAKHGRKHVAVAPVLSPVTFICRIITGDNHRIWLSENILLALCH